MTSKSASRTATTPVRGDRVPGFSGKTPAGEPISLHDFYLRRNLALVFTHDVECGSCRDYLMQLTEQRSAIQAEAADVLAVIPGSAGIPDLPFPTVLDADHEIHRRFGLVDESGQPRAAIFLIDRYGIVFESSQANEKHDMLEPDEVPGWLEFIACRCS